MIRSYIALGSNQGAPLAQIYGALNALKRLPGCRLTACSRLYGSRAIGPGQQDDYINAVAAIETALPPDELLTALQAIEAQHGRQRDIRWGPRTLDLDILSYGDQEIHNEHLKIPHPRAGERRFVLLPLEELDSELAAQLCQNPEHLLPPGDDDLWLIEDSEQSRHAE